MDIKAGVYLERWKSREFLAYFSHAAEACSWIEHTYDIMNPPPGDFVHISRDGTRAMLLNSRPGGCVFQEGVEALLEAAVAQSSEVLPLALRLKNVIKGEYE